MRSPEATREIHWIGRPRSLGVQESRSLNSKDALGRLARNLWPVARLFCDLALFSRSGMSGMSVYRHTYQQTVLLLLAEGV
jgi:hypothetical protein